MKFTVKFIPNSSLEPDYLEDNIEMGKARLVAARYIKMIRRSEDNYISTIEKNFSWEIESNNNPYTEGLLVIEALSIKGTCDYCGKTISERDDSYRLLSDYDSIFCSEFCAEENEISALRELSEVA